MIIVDLNQVVFSTLVIQPKNTKVDEDLVRHIVLNCLRSYRNKFSEEYGELIIASDNKNYWRREYFPLYKAHRKKARDASGMNWAAIFECMAKIKNELKETFPYKYIDVDGAEADDVISVIVENASYSEPILIISGDKDFIQLQKLKPLVKQYDPIRKKYVTHKDPEEYLIEHIIRGDAGDGIPNIRSSDDIFVTNGRQKTISAKMLQDWKENGIPSELQRNYERNKNLIDLTQIPEQVKINIERELAKEPEGSRSKLFNYFYENSLKNLMEHISEF